MKVQKKAKTMPEKYTDVRIKDFRIKILGRYYNTKELEQRPTISNLQEMLPLKMKTQWLSSVDHHPYRITTSANLPFLGNLSPVLNIS